MTHFGVTADKLIGAFGLTPERALELAQQGMTWALPNLTLGALVIMPVWFVVYLFRPPRAAQRLELRATCARAARRSIPAWRRRTSSAATPRRCRARPPR